MRRFFLAVLPLLFAPSVMAQTTPPPPPPPMEVLPLPRLSASDSTALVARLSTPDTMIAMLYRVISGPAGQKRDWNLFRRLFIPTAQLVATGRDPQGRVRYRAMTPEDYIRRAGPSLEQNGFFETETHRVVEQYGHVYHAFSTYDSRNLPTDAEPFARGINSIQLLQMGGRWWIVSIFWGDEQATAMPIPSRYHHGTTH